MTKKKTVTIIMICAVVLLLGYIAVASIVPRIMLHNLIQETLTDVGKGAEYFTEYSAAHTGKTIAVDNGHISIEIPAECNKKENPLEVLQYVENERHGIIIMEPTDFGTEMNLLNPENFDSSDYKVKIGLDELTAGFEGFGNGLPDSAYGTYKCTYMLDEEDYNPLSLKNQVAYSVTGALKMAFPQFGTVFVYENDDIRGFVHIRENEETEDGKYRVTMEIYSTDNLNVVTSVVLETDNLEEAYAVMNSARPAA